MTGIEFSVPISKIEQFEKQNKISINVFMQLKQTTGSTSDQQF
jgi:hypothetical protein